MTASAVILAILPALGVSVSAMILPWVHDARRADRPDHRSDLCTRLPANILSWRGHCGRYGTAQHAIPSHDNVAIHLRLAAVPRDHCTVADRSFPLCSFRRRRPCEPAFSSSASNGTDPAHRGHKTVRIKATCRASIRLLQFLPCPDSCPIFRGPIGPDSQPSAGQFVRREPPLTASRESLKLRIPTQPNLPRS